MEKKCPADGSSLSTVDVNGVNVDTCKECEGVWFDQSELRHVLGQEPSEAKKDLPQAWDAEIENLNSTRSDRHCPVCQEELNMYKYAYDSGIEIDGCKNHHGVWLDDGEIQNTFKYYTQATEELSEEQKAKVQALLDREKIRVDNWHESIKDDMVSADDEGGLMALPGHALQAVYNLMYEIDERF